MHTKQVATTDWVSMVPTPVTLVKVAANGWGSNDLNEFMKVAGESSTAMVKEALTRKRPGESLLFSSALGCAELYGPNKNADAFKAAACRTFHPTFVKFGKWFRDHDNKPTSKRYGRHVASGFNEKMGRVEVVTALYETKKAAEELEGDLGEAADLEMEKIAAGKNVATSMSCNIDYDVCSGCGNKAKNRSEYCNAKMCKYGGCQSNLNKVAEDGHLLHVDNPHPIWFDLSHITNDRQADRIAHAYGLLKSASEGTTPQLLNRYSSVFEALREQERKILSGNTPVGGVEWLAHKAAGENIPESAAGLLPYASWKRQFGHTPNTTIFGIFSKSARDMDLLAKIVKAADRHIVRPMQVVSGGVPLGGPELMKAAAKAVLEPPVGLVRDVNGMSVDDASYAGYVVAKVAHAQNLHMAANVAVRVILCMKS